MKITGVVNRNKTLFAASPERGDTLMFQSVMIGMLRTMMGNDKGGAQDQLVSEHVSAHPAWQKLHRCHRRMRSWYHPAPRACTLSPSLTTGAVQGSRTTGQFNTGLFGSEIHGSIRHGVCLLSAFPTRRTQLAKVIPSIGNAIDWIDLLGLPVISCILVLFPRHLHRFPHPLLRHFPRSLSTEPSTPFGNCTPAN